MAKLSARGRTEVARMVKMDHTPDSDLTVWSRKTVALMSDGKVLIKHDCEFKDVEFGSPKHSYGWKVKGKIKAEVTPEQWKELYQKLGYEPIR